MSSRPHLNTVFVLGGGGNLGAVQVGMLYALLAAGIKPDGLVGTSIGALNGAFLAGHPDLAGIKALAALWESVRRRDVFPMRIGGLLRGAFGQQPFLFGSLGLRRMLRRADLGFERLEEAPIPLRVVATDLGARDAMVLERGDVVPALLASSAIPGVYPPVEIDGRTLVDGGIVANNPIAQAEAFDPQVIYVLPTLPDYPYQLPANALVMMQRVMALAGFSAEQRALTEAASRREVRVLPVPESAAKLSLFDFGATRRLIDEAYLLTTAWLRGSGSRLPQEVGSFPRHVPGRTPFGAVQSEVA
jgi:NTE family protein